MANPTTNYGWPMPTSTDLVTDLPADFAAFGQPVDTSLKALNPETTLGDIAYRSSTSNTNTRLGIGSTGQVLTVAAGVPSWASASTGAVTLISQQTVTGSNVATITFSSIPGTYKNLRIEYQAFSVSGTNVLCRFNSDTGSNYDKQQFRAYATNTLGAEAIGVTSLTLGTIGDSNNANNTGGGTYTIPNYAATIMYKVGIGTNFTKYGTSTGNLSYGLFGGSWRNTAAITNIDLVTDSGNFVVGSSFTLYGES